MRYWRAYLQKSKANIEKIRATFRPVYSLQITLLKSLLNTINAINKQIEEIDSKISEKIFSRSET
jgi:hypothetical protein